MQVSLWTRPAGVRILIPRAATPGAAERRLGQAARGTLRTGYCDREIGEEDRQAKSNRA